MKLAKSKTAFLSILFVVSTLNLFTQQAVADEAGSVSANTDVVLDNDLYGTWKPVEYVLNGKSVPLKGVTIITPDYFVGNATFDVDNDGVPEANANSGPITVENGVIKLVQWMQLHWRPTDESEHFLHIDIPEDIHYVIEGDKLIFNFPSGNRYIHERVLQ